MQNKNKSLYKIPVYKHYMYINTVYKMFANKNIVINLHTQNT